VLRPSTRLLTLLFVAELFFSAAEGLFVVYPLLLFFPKLSSHLELLFGLGAALILWCALLVSGLRVVLGRREQASRYRAAKRLPGRMLLFRLALWGMLGLGSSLYLVNRGALTSEQMFTVLTICLVHSLAVSLLRWALHKRSLRSYLDRARLEPPWLKLQLDTLLDRLTEVALVLGAITAGSLTPFVLMFVPISLEQFMKMETYFPWTGVVLGAIWYYVVVPRQTRPVVEYLRRAADGEAPPPEVLQRACVNAHRLPQMLALCKVGFFVVGATLLLLESLALYEFSVAQGALVFFAIVIATFGTGIYEMIWSRAVLRKVVAHLMAQPGADHADVRALSIKAKMTLAFGGAVMFTVLLAFFWTYLQYGNLRRDFTTTQAQRELAWAAAKLDASRPQTLARQLARLDSARGSVRLHVPARGRAPKLLPSTAVSTIRRRSSGVLELADRRLAGFYRRLDPSRPVLGSLVVLLPLGESARFALNLQVLVFFFLVVLSVSLGVVMLTSADLTQPLAQLEQRAVAMAQGRLDQPVLPGGEFDEIGRVTDAFEQMRRALKEKLETIEELNVSLEEKVRLRTAELSRSNAELVEAIRALKETQQQLITSEKLASIGQLVAGIAHEINNPVNAVINTVRPLSETVEEVIAGSTSREEARADLEAMLRVIRSGAERTQRIVQALRNYSRQDAEERSPVDLNADIEETLALLQHKLRGVQVERELESGPFVAYRGQLNQALMNLLSNAAQALEGVADPRVVVRAFQDGEGHTVVEVEDNGPGIPEDVLPRIFDPFFTTKEVGKGTGLGLSITQRIAERHGGGISVSSRPGRTVFRLTLPGA